MPGVADFVTALTGGRGLEQAAYDKAMQRMLDQKNTQAQIDQRVQQAYLLARQNEAQEGFGRSFAALMTNRADPNAPWTSNEMASIVPQMLAAGGFDFSDATTGLDNLVQTIQRAAINDAAAKEGFTDVNRAALTFKPELVPGVSKVGDLVVSNLYGTPTVEGAMTDRMAAASAAGDKSGTKGVREQKIQDAMTLYGFDRPTAVAFVDGYIKQDINENTGRVVRQNILPEGSISIPGYGAASEIPIGGAGPDAPTPAPATGQTLYELANYGTGLANSAQDLIARGVTLFGGETDMTPTKAIQTINTATNEMIRALSINPRFPVGEINRLREEIRMTPGWLTSPEVMQSRMESVAQSLTLRLEQAERDAANPNLSQDIRQAQSDNAVAIRNFLPQLGVPGYGGSTGPSVSTTPPPAGSRVIRFELDADGNLVPVQ